MAKTRSQTGNIAVKKEQDCKPPLTLASASNKTRNKITKRRPSTKYTSILTAQQVKVEEDADTKSLLKPTSKCTTTRRISKEQINQLINYIVHDGMGITKAARTAKISFSTASYYYNVYKNDPEKKIPSSRDGSMHPYRVYTQEHIENLIRYIVDDKMSVVKASAKANMSYSSSRYYYKRYLQDPNHAIPVPYSRQYYMQEQKNKFIGYIVNDKMSIKTASLKAKVHIVTGQLWCRKYFDFQNPDIAKPSHIAVFKRLTQEQIKDLINYIVNDNMSVRAAARKANMNQTSAGCYYRQYLKDNNMELPVSNRTRRYTQDDINKVVGYIVDDKMTLVAASKKANVSYDTGRKYYYQYLKNRNIEIRASKHTEDKKNRLISYIVDDKMTVQAASKKQISLIIPVVNITRNTEKITILSHLFEDVHRIK